MGKNALVLGGGGTVGVAWELGLMLGLADRGFDANQVDHIIGTSAGSFIGALITTGCDASSGQAGPYGVSTEVL